jgi:hypothetical protein
MPGWQGFYLAQKKTGGSRFFYSCTARSVTSLAVIFGHWCGKRETEKGEEAEEFHF